MGVDQGDPSKFEQLKANSNYLREPLSSELKNDTPFFTDGAVQILKFHGSYQQDNRDNRRKGQEKDWQMMLRLRNPGGRVPAQLYLAIDKLSEQLGNGTLRISTRQAFQMHGIPKIHLHEVISTIIRNLGSTLSACGDINRNVMAPAAPFEWGGYPAARKLADEIADLLAPQAAEGSYLDLWVDGDLSFRIKPSVLVEKVRSSQKNVPIFSGEEDEPLYGITFLPRKFKVGVTVPGDNSIDLLTQDIGLVAFADSSGKLEGCNVYVGGGMGRTHNKEETFARTADPLGYVEGENVLDLVQAILALQRDYGNRQVRRHARMKYLINERGIVWFKQKVAEYFKGSLHRMRLEGNTKLSDYLGWHKQSCSLWFVGLPLLCGRLGGELKRELRGLVEKYQVEIRLTANQDLLLCNIEDNDLDQFKVDLANVYESAQSFTPLARHAIACPALPTCGLAITESERIFPKVLDRLDALLSDLDIKTNILVRMTGCPNGCARPYMAELGLVGSGVDQYQLWLGGTPNLMRLAKPYLQRMPLDELETVLRPLFSGWRESSNHRSFGDYIEDIGEATVLQLLGM
ncbi:MAG TPA: NADPH-dependent assimilatory sulfite reductase hemoprotein subunit [Prochlorococcaceae cyanobacterium AMR_MDS_5431]|nr:NADPH-dependent assimilatory sulfite reductase hemoprotein subunit [Prochlorococcaceae cyanobacterium AMR_MDS_5431]